MLSTKPSFRTFPIREAWINKPIFESRKSLANKSQQSPLSMDGWKNLRIFSFHFLSSFFSLSRQNTSWWWLAVKLESTKSAIYLLAREKKKTDRPQVKDQECTPFGVVVLPHSAADPAGGQDQAWKEAWGGINLSRVRIRTDLCNLLLGLFADEEWKICKNWKQTPCSRWAWVWWVVLLKYSRRKFATPWCKIGTLFRRRLKGVWVSKRGFAQLCGCLGAWNGNQAEL